MEFSEILKEVMLEQNLNQTQLAKKINLKQSQISEWLNGKSKPGYDSVKLLTKALDISSERLLGFED